MVTPRTQSGGRYQSLFEYRHIQPCTVAGWLLWSVWSISFIWLNQSNRIDQTDQIDQADPLTVFRCWRRMELRGFYQQDARDLKVGEHHIRGSIEGLVVGALESIAFNRRAGQCAHLGHKVFDVFMGDVKRVVVQE